MIKMIAAVAEGGVIGYKGTIPWDLPEDRRMFRELTMGHILILGRVTYESIGGPLPGRDMIVVTSHAKEVLDSVKRHAVPTGTVQTADSLKKALRMAGEKECFLCGGERIYSEGLPHTEVLYLTRVELEVVKGDAFFPTDYEKYLKLVGRERLSANCTVLTYVKK